MVSTSGAANFFIVSALIVYYLHSVNGAWSDWSNWSTCSVSCGWGRKLRTRKCTKPTELSSCKGKRKQKTKCYSGVPCPINGGLGEWSKWSECSVTCDWGLKRRKRECNNPEPKHGGLPCKGRKKQKRKCNTKIPCPVDGGWSHWSEWSKCSVTCDWGTAGRKRECNKPVPKYGGKICAGDNLETRKCYGGIPCKIHGNWGDWGGWSECSKTCKPGGIQLRYRPCDSPKPQFGGDECKGTDTDKKDCNNKKECPVDGMWSSWSSFSACNVKCGQGNMTRIRRCDNPIPKFGGKKCEGESRKYWPCYREKCRAVRHGIGSGEFSGSGSGFQSGSGSGFQSGSGSGSQSGDGSGSIVVDVDTETGETAVKTTKVTTLKPISSGSGSGDGSGRSSSGDGDIDTESGDSVQSKGTSSGEDSGGVSVGGAGSGSKASGDDDEWVDVMKESPKE